MSTWSVYASAGLHDMSNSGRGTRRNSICLRFRNTIIVNWNIRIRIVTGLKIHIRNYNVPVREFAKTKRCAWYIIVYNSRYGRVKQTYYARAARADLSFCNVYAREMFKISCYENNAQATHRGKRLSARKCTLPLYKNVKFWKKIITVALYNTCGQGVRYPTRRTSL